jgi:hypothetical protein
MHATLPRTVHLTVTTTPLHQAPELTHGPDIRPHLSPTAWSRLPCKRWPTLDILVINAPPSISTFNQSYAVYTPALAHIHASIPSDVAKA